MAEIEQQSVPAEGLATEGVEFAALLQKEFKPKTEEIGRAHV